MTIEEKRFVNKQLATTGLRLAKSHEAGWYVTVHLYDEPIKVRATELTNTVKIEVEGRRVVWSVQ